VRQDGSRFWANVVITALYDGGELRGFAKVTRDETERRLAENRERALELVRDRERIAQRMNEHVIHQIFEVSLLLEGARQVVHDPDGIRRIDDAIERLDGVLHDIRSAIVDLDAGG
jgi:signal transduction histidine kinase